MVNATIFLSGIQEEKYGMAKLDGNQGKVKVGACVMAALGGGGCSSSPRSVIRNLFCD